jgi:TolB-like protein/DNA-binding SARP family transcriptional activator/Tfp pilus assembly protein PilF
MSGHIRLRLRLLGRFAASTEGALPQMVQISAPRHRVLLAYLAMRPTYAETRERLATLLWSDRPDKQARQNLRQLLLTLHQELAPAGVDPLQVERDQVGLDPALIMVDAREFQALAQSEAEQELAGAGEVEYGTFLDGVSLESESFEAWLRIERTRLDAAAAQTFLRCAELHDAAGRGAAAIRAAERLIGLDPLRESAQRLSLRLLARYRGRDAALAHAAQFIGLLREEVDADPEPETVALIAEIEALKEKAPRGTEHADATRRQIAPAATVSIAAQEARTTAASDAPATAQPRPGAWPARAVAGVAVAAVAAIALVFAALSTRDTSTVVTTTEPPVAAPDPQSPDVWRSPTILAGVRADAQVLAAQGAYALVLLPFTAAADRGEERVLADRVTDDLTNELSRVPALRVIARATARVYAGRPVDVAAIGTELGVRYVVEGSVQLQDGRLRINAALIDVATRLQVWSDRFEREAAERFAVQDEIARSIARHLNVSVYAAEGQRRGPPRPGDPAVDELLAKGWNAIIRSFELGTTSGADSYFEEVLRRQPGNGSAMLGLAGYKLAVVAQFQVPRREPHLSEADALVTKVLNANPRSHMGIYYRGLLHKLRGEPQDALAQFTKVLEMNPSFAPAYANVGHVMSRAGRPDEALEHVRYAIRLSPKDPNLGNWSLYAGQIELERGRDAAALEWIKRAAALHPRSPFNHATLAAALALTGDAPGAARHAATVAELAPWLTLDIMVERLTSTSEPAAAPHRLIEGLRKAFGGTTG